MEESWESLIPTGATGKQKTANARPRKRKRQATESSGAGSLRNGQSWQRRPPANLHRAELTVLERSNQIARWIELTTSKQIAPDNASQLATHKNRGQQPGGINAASRELGIERTEASEQSRSPRSLMRPSRPRAIAPISRTRRSTPRSGRMFSRSAPVGRRIFRNRFDSGFCQGIDNVAASIDRSVGISDMTSWVRYTSIRETSDDRAWW